MTLNLYRNLLQIFYKSIVLLGFSFNSLIVNILTGKLGSFVGIKGFIFIFLFIFRMLGCVYHWGWCVRPWRAVTTLHQPLSGTHCSSPGSLPSTTWCALLTLPLPSLFVSCTKLFTKYSVNLNFKYLCFSLNFEL